MTRREEYHVSILGGGEVKGWGRGMIREEGDSGDGRGGGRERGRGKG